LAPICFNGYKTSIVSQAPSRVNESAEGANGAGDMFAGAFLYVINAGHNYAWAAKFANAASVRVVSQFGPRIDAVEYEQINSNLVFR
jgi:sugar/nucleoside kinase (ribokinase family)